MIFPPLLRQPHKKITRNDTIPNQYIIKQGLKYFGKKAKLQYKNNRRSFMTVELLNQISLKTSAMNN